MIRMECFTAVGAVPIDAWERFVSRDAVGLELEHLRAVEESGINDIQPFYILGYQNLEPVGIAYCFSIQIDLAAMANAYPPKILSSVKQWKPDFMIARVIEVGHIASLGMTVEAPRTHLPEFLRALNGVIGDIARQENADLCFFRDVPAARYPDFSVLEERGYEPVPGFPVARMRLAWRSFDGYLAALKAKRRNNIRRRRAKLLATELEVEIIENYAPYSDRLAELWMNVARRNNGYVHERLIPAFFDSMCSRLPGRSHVVAIRRHQKIVAFGLNLVGDSEYFGMAEGMDYELRDTYDLYANNMLEGIRVACEMGKTSYNIGITSYDFKTFIGADIHPCYYFVKAVRPADCSSVYIDMFRTIMPQPEVSHRAFRDDERPVMAPSARAVTSPHQEKYSRDPFAKHLRYNRADAARMANLYTYCPIFESAQGPVIRHQGRNVIMLGSNSYLGLSTHPKLRNAMHEAIDIYGSGCSGSPLLNGTLDLHDRLSKKLARFTGKQKALVFSTGYQTNLGVVSSLVNRDDILIMDKRNHASLIDGARLSGATLVRYAHNDLESLYSALSKYADRPKLVVTDSLFSMEGTIIDLPGIVRLVRRYGARLMLDESHAIGVIGDTGRGVAEYYGMLDEIDIIMGTFSKSFASIGGFVAGNRKILDTLKHTSRSHIFSASLPPAAVAAVLAAIEIVDEEPWRRERVLESAKILADGLRSMGYEIGWSGGPIISVLCGHELIALAAYQQLFDDGVFVNPVTWPAVPKGREMLRISLMVTHDETMLAKALDVFRRAKTAAWPSRKSSMEGSESDAYRYAVHQVN